ncbi:putative Serine/threonine-protein kinase ppk19 [Glarea lozoyensis 74030]|uniref:non-specific serine/threonine protein kinase n=1 Tax=Glarea lozoyensis (strain ATCC 74030 / MF5533) TaxID=1104152 RepID=H0ES97_GLAL7|nr:putative Serine/threonine-protein kinase ppk19 [Glarea lozoyensis 74030]
MDIFSAGCVLAELFLEGPLLTLESLFRYQRGEFDVKTQLSRIVDKDVRDLIAHMIQLDPEKRFSAEEYLQFWAKKRLTDEAKLDRVLPHFIMLLYDPADVVKVAAIRSMTQLLALVTVVSPMNAHVFPEYILQNTQELLHGSKKKPRPLVRATYAACLGSLATSASRFLDMVATLRADGSLPTIDTETDDGIKSHTGAQGLFDNTRAELIIELEAHTKSLITDPDTSVKQAFLGSVPELCMFFGTADSNDIILSHLNTYLNDRNWILKCAFFETIVGVATFLGGTSLEEFMLPLMVQALTDPEEFVIQRVLHSFATMAELGLFSRSKTWELVDVVGRFTMHPNIWIREAAAMFLSASTLFLSMADTQCIILPLIRPYLKNPLRDLSELSILGSLKKPFSRSLLDLSITWALKVDRGIFWKQATKLRTFSFDSNNTIPTILSKDLGPHALQKIPKNEEDEQWLKKLRNMGLTSEDEFKLLSMREYIWRLSASKAHEPASQTSNLNNIINLRKIGITPQTVLFDEKAMTEEVEQVIKRVFNESNKPHTIADALLDASMTIDDPIAIRRRSAFNSHQSKRSTREGLSPTMPAGHDNASPVSTPGTPRETHNTTSSRFPGSSRPSRPSVTLNGSRRPSDDDTSSVPDTLSSLNSRDHNHTINHRTSAMDLIGRKDSAKSSKSSPETATSSTNAFGKVEGPFSNAGGDPSALALARGMDSGTNDRIKFRGAHTYTGNDPSILKMLDAMYVDNYPMDIAVFGPIIAPSSRSKALSRSTSQPVTQPWKPEGILVTTFSEHVGPLHHISIAPDHVFFLTGGDDACVKVWDSGRLERNIAHKSRATHKHAVGARISALCFVENTHSFISCASDGTINLDAPIQQRRMRVLARSLQVPDPFGGCIYWYWA